MFFHVSHLEIFLSDEYSSLAKCAWRRHGENDLIEIKDKIGFYVRSERPVQPYAQISEKGIMFSYLYKYAFIY
jgi:hypothetical protein